MNNFVCKKCGCTKYVIDKENGVHIGMYCSNCNSWIKWISKKEAQLLENNLCSDNQNGNEQDNCEYCDKEWGMCDSITNRFVTPPEGHINYCPICGKKLNKNITLEDISDNSDTMEHINNDNVVPW